MLLLYRTGCLLYTSVSAAAAWVEIKTLKVSQPPGVLFMRVVFVCGDKHADVCSQRKNACS